MATQFALGNGLTQCTTVINGNTFGDFFSQREIFNAGLLPCQCSKFFNFAVASLKSVNLGFGYQHDERCVVIVNLIFRI